MEFQDSYQQRKEEIPQEKTIQNNQIIINNKTNEQQQEQNNKYLRTLSEANPFTSGDDSEDDSLKSSDQTKDEQQQQNEQQSNQTIPLSICQKMSQLIHPYSKKKFYWDMIIIALSLFNAVYVPIEITLARQQLTMNILNNIFDAFFIIDIIVCFRTIYIDDKTQQEVSDPKKISRRYIYTGRFFIDLIASLPVELLAIILGNRVSSGALRIIRIIKLTRLFRLGRIINYLRMKKSIKQGIRFVALGTFFILILHWFSIFTYFVILQNKAWIPPKDIEFSDKFHENLQDIVFNDFGKGYSLMFYYGCLYLFANDIFPTTMNELLLSILFCFCGAITLFILVAQFLSLIQQVTRKQRVKNQKVEFLQQSMYNLQLPEKLQEKILDYHERQTKSKFIIGNEKLNILAPSLIQKVTSHSLAHILVESSLLKSEHNYLANLVCQQAIVQIFLPEGFVEVIRENSDFTLEEYQYLIDQAYEDIHDQSKQKKFVRDLANQTKISKKRRSSPKVFKKQDQDNPNKNVVYIPKLKSCKITKLIILLVKSYTSLREIMKGGFFGEISMITNLKTTATVHSLHYATCAQISQKCFYKLIKKSREFKKRIYDHMDSYKDDYFNSMIAILENVKLFRSLNRKTLKQIIYLFQEERYVNGNILLRKRERSKNIFFIKRGEVEVRFIIDGDQEQEVVTFTKLAKGSYFNLSNALLKKFSLFEFVVISENASILKLNAADLVLQGNKDEQLTNVLKSHSIFYQVDGQKYDFDRFYRKSILDEDVRKYYVQNMMKNFLHKFRISDLSHLNVFKHIDELFQLRREKYIEIKKKQYEEKVKEELKQELHRNQMKSKSDDQPKVQELSEEVLHKLVNQAEDSNILINQVQTHLKMMLDKIEQDINDYVAKKKELRKQEKTNQGDQNDMSSLHSFDNKEINNVTYSSVGVYDFRELLNNDQIDQNNNPIQEADDQHEIQQKNKILSIWKK